MYIFLILLSTILYTVSFPKFSLWWVSFFSLVPFLVALDRSRSGINAFFYGVLWSVGYCFGMGYWVFFTILNHYEVPFAKSLLFFSLCVILPVIFLYAGFALIYRFLNGRGLFFYALVVPSIWVLTEYIKEVVSFLIPWGGIEFALVPFTQFIQIADLTGGYGILFIAVAVNSLLVYLIKQLIAFRTSQTAGILQSESHSQVALGHAIVPLILIMMLIGIPVIYGSGVMKKVDAAVLQSHQSGQSVEAVLVQGNFSTKERWSGMGFYQRIMSYLEMSFENGPDAGEDARRVIVWPETTLNSSSKLNDELFVEIMRYIGENSLLVSGGLKTDAKSNDVFNSAYFISGSGRLLRYDKHILLPYAETSPLIDLLDAYYTAPSEFSQGRSPLSIDAPGGSVGTSICFEVLYPGFIRKAVKDGAQYLVNISNDSWFGDSPMPYIHLSAARLRAIENRRFLLRTSNSGISAVISPTGKIMAQSGLYTKERVTGDFVILDQLSFYARFGNLIFFAAAGILLAALIQVILKKD